jgi:hypothetical protein
LSEGNLDTLAASSWRLHGFALARLSSWCHGFGFPSVVTSLLMLHAGLVSHKHLVHPTAGTRAAENHAADRTALFALSSICWKTLSAAVDILACLWCRHEGWHAHVSSPLCPVNGPNQERRECQLPCHSCLTLHAGVVSGANNACIH